MKKITLLLYIIISLATFGKVISHEIGVTDAEVKKRSSEDFF